MDKEKKDFIFKRGVFGVGLPVGILMALTMAFQVPGYLFRLQGFSPKVFVIGMVLYVPIFMAAGFIWGILVYKYSRKK